MLRIVDQEYECPKCGHKECHNVFTSLTGGSGNVLNIGNRVFCFKCFMKIIEQIVPEMTLKEVVTEHPDRIHL